ncbi:MAG: beta strand repeat-containing protein, partial [Elusimicrobiota bacterium]
SALSASSTTGTAFSYQIAATNSPTSFSAAGLPAGLSVNTSNGLITGTPSTAGTTNVTIGAVNAAGTGTATLVVTINPPAPVITSALSASSTTGTAFSYQIAATNSPTSFSAAGLPAGLTVNTSNGLITGTPNTAGIANVTIGAANAGGTGTATLVVTLNPPAPVITSALSASSTTGTAFSYQIAATNSPTSFSAAGLPAGLTVNMSNGLITGTPSSAGTTNVTIGAANAGGTGAATLVVTINPPAPVITSALSASSTTGTVFSYQITGTNVPTSFSAANLPPGLSVNASNGLITGTPTSSGTTNIGLGAANAGGTGTATLVLTLIPPPPVITSGLIATAETGKAFSYQITGTNAPTSFSAANLPAGLHVNASNGLITGTPKSPGITDISLGVANSGGTGTAVLVLEIDPPPPVITSTLAVAGTAGAPFSYQIAATNLATTFGAANLPAGLSVNASNGLISGTPISAGTADVALSAANAGGTGTAALILTISPPPPVITSALAVMGIAGTPFSYQLAATNSPTSFGAVNLPAGLSVNASDGLISGTPLSSGTANVGLSASNAGGTGAAVLVLKIDPRTLVVTSTLAAFAVVGAPFSYQIEATNSPNSFGAANLPAGLGVNTSNGLITGTPRSSGTVAVVLTAADAGGAGSATLILTISPPPPVITSSLAASGIAGSAFGYQIAATNSPTTFSAANLPAGLKVNAISGLITGTPISSGTARVVLGAANAAGAGAAALILTIKPPAPVITSALAASGNLGTPFKYQIEAVNSPTSFNAANLPGGLSVDASNGLITGMPTAMGTSDVVLTAVNAGGASTATAHFTISASLVTAAADLSQVRVYPIPYRPNSGNPDLGGGGTGITFDRLPSFASIKIYSVAGQLVSAFDVNSPSGATNWGARNGGGAEVASGLYLAVISSPSGGPVTKKILIIR